MCSEPADARSPDLEATYQSNLEAFAYDPVHNRTQRTAAGVDERFVFDAANQLLEVRNGLASNALIGALVYDANGNLKKKCTGSVTSTGSDCTGSSVLSLTFDASNRLAQAVGPNGTETYGYDDQGRRIRKTVNGVNTFYLYNGDDIVAEYGDGWAKPNAITLHGAGTDDPIARYTRNGSGGYDKAYYHADGLGSVVALTKDDGTISGAQMFDSWGAKIAGSSIGIVPAYGYTGREPDATGLIYYRARYYDPSIGRFVSQDPVGMEGGLNYYAYVRNNPTNFNDPLGLLASPIAIQVAQANQQYYGEPVQIACAPLCTGLGAVPGRAITPPPGGAPGYQGLPQQRQDPGGYEAQLGLPTTTPPSVGQQLWTAWNTLISPITDVVEWGYNLIFNQSSQGGSPPQTPKDILMPGGQPIGQPGTSPEIRVLPGGLRGAEEMFDKLMPQGGKDVTAGSHSGIVVELPNGGGFVGFRPSSQSGPPTIDVNIPGVGIRKLKFPTGP